MFREHTGSDGMIVSLLSLFRGASYLCAAPVAGKQVAVLPSEFGPGKASGCHTCIEPSKESNFKISFPPSLVGKRIPNNWVISSCDFDFFGADHK
jgi:hypothetical protein